jgi:hypothetical protein
MKIEHKCLSFVRAEIGLREQNEDRTQMTFLCRAEMDLSDQNEVRTQMPFVC